MDDRARRGLSLIRFALLVSPLPLAVAAWGGAAGGGLEVDVLRGVELYVTAGLVVVFLGLFGGVLALRSRWQAVEGFAEKKPLNIIGWALAEMASLLGVAYLFLGGSAVFLGAGLALQGLASFVLLPMPEREV